MQRHATEYCILVVTPIGVREGQKKTVTGSNECDLGKNYVYSVEKHIIIEVVT